MLHLAVLLLLYLLLLVLLLMSGIDSGCCSYTGPSLVWTLTGFSSAVLLRVVVAGVEFAAFPALVAAGCAGMLQQQLYDGAAPITISVLVLINIIKR